MVESNVALVTHINGKPISDDTCVEFVMSCEPDYAREGESVSITWGEGHTTEFDCVFTNVSWYRDRWYRRFWRAVKSLASRRRRKRNMDSWDRTFGVPLGLCKNTRK